MIPRDQSFSSSKLFYTVKLRPWPSTIPPLFQSCLKFNTPQELHKIKHCNPESYSWFWFMAKLHIYDKLSTSLSLCKTYNCFNRSFTHLILLIRYILVYLHLANAHNVPNPVLGEHQEHTHEERRQQPPARPGGLMLACQVKTSRGT